MLNRVHERADHLRQRDEAEAPRARAGRGPQLEHGAYTGSRM